MTMSLSLLTVYSRDVNMDTDIVRQMLPSFTEIRDHRIELRCTYEETSLGEKAKMQASLYRG